MQIFEGSNKANPASPEEARSSDDAERQNCDFEIVITEIVAPVKPRGVLAE